MPPDHTSLELRQSSLCHWAHPVRYLGIATKNEERAVRRSLFFRDGKINCSLRHWRCRGGSLTRPPILRSKMGLPQAIIHISLREIRKLFQFPAGGSLTLPYSRFSCKLQFICSLPQIHPAFVGTQKLGSGIGVVAQGQIRAAHVEGIGGFEFGVLG